MSLATINGSMLSRLYSVTSAAPAVEQDRVIGAFMNSLYYHADELRNVPVWQHRMAVARGGQSIAAQADFGFAHGWAKNPPNYHQDWTPYVTHPGAASGGSSNWPSIETAGFTDIIMVSDNFTGPPYGPGMETNPRLGGSVPEAGADDYVTEFADCITPFEANTTGTKNYWVYEGWANAELDLNTDGSGTSQEFETYRGRTSTDYGYNGWFDSLVTELRVDVPSVASRINLIPASRCLISVMENTAASSLTAADWFEDDAPHGRDVCYLIAAMAAYAVMFQEQPPTPSFTGSTVPAVVQSNYTAIAAHVATVAGI